MKITELLLLDGYQGKTYAWDNLSIINNIEIIWNYRSGLKGHVYNLIVPRSKAVEITLEDGSRRKIQLGHCNNHESVFEIHHQHNILMGL